MLADIQIYSFIHQNSIQIQCSHDIQMWNIPILCQILNVLLSTEEKKILWDPSAEYPGKILLPQFSFQY